MTNSRDRRKRVTQFLVEEFGMNLATATDLVTTAPAVKGGS